MVPVNRRAAVWGFWTAEFLLVRNTERAALENDSHGGFMFPVLSQQRRIVQTWPYPPINWWVPLRSIDCPELWRWFSDEHFCPNAHKEHSQSWWTSYGFFSRYHIQTTMDRQASQIQPFNGQSFGTRSEDDRENMGSRFFLSTRKASWNSWRHRPKSLTSYL